jgi:hypothetical protein
MGSILDTNYNVHTIMPPVPPDFNQENQNTIKLESMNNEGMSNNKPLTILHPDKLEPIVSNKPSFVEGEFLYIKDLHSREMLQNGWKAIDQLELWSYMKKPTDSYTMSDDVEINIITKKMEKLGYNGHSGFSFGWTMRQLQCIAQKGEQQYMENIILKQ